MRSVAALAVLVISGILAAQAQRRMPRTQMPTNGTLATLVRRANLYASADENSQQIAQVSPGRELVIVEQNGRWVRVFANTDAPDTRKSDQPMLDAQDQPQPISGWMLDKGIVDTRTPHGDLILFGAADTVEQQATVPNAPPGTAEEARLLYRRVYVMFPDSPWTPEAMYRAADIRWQIQKADASTLPSAHERQAYLRQQMDEDEMRNIQKYFPHTKWADLAAFQMIDNKLCGDWQGSEKCPEQESGYYLQYVHDHPDSPKAAEALYDAAWRQASAGDMWAADGNRKRADEDRGHAIAIVQGMEQQFPNSAFTARGADLVYKVQQGIAVYGNSRE